MPTAPLAAQTPTPVASRAEHYGLRAVGLVDRSWEEVAFLRKSVGPPGGEPFARSVLKTVDEQTVLAMAAVVEAAETSDLQNEDFSKWGVIAGPRYLGRVHSAEFCRKYDEGGARKLSLFFVPHRSLHSASGTISQSLKIHGPNFGVGGSVNAFAETLMTAYSLLDEQELPGLWVVLTQCHPEPRPDLQGFNTIPVRCYGLAMAFTRHGNGPRLSMRPSEGGTCKQDDEKLFGGLHDYLSEGAKNSQFGTWKHALDWGFELRLSDES